MGSDQEQTMTAQSQPQYPQYLQQYAPVPQVIPYSRPWAITKIVFYLFSIVFSIIALGISIALVVDPTIYQSYEILWVAPQAGVALIWDMAELITICARRGKRGIHPGAHVAMHLLLWLGFGVAVALTGWLAAYWLECGYFCYYYDYYSADNPAYTSTLQAELAFLALLVLVHFVLFVRACVETNQRNGTAFPVIMIPQQTYHAQKVAQYPFQTAQQSYLAQPQRSHVSGYYGRPREVQSQLAGSAHVSQPSTTTPNRNSGVHPLTQHPQN